jgi:excisionase family DNA binding protein
MDTSITTDRFADILCADDVATWLKVDRKTIYNAASHGKIPHQRLGKRLLFSRAALVSWLACESGSVPRR